MPDQSISNDWRRDPRAFVVQRLGPAAPLIIIAIVALATLGLLVASGRTPLMSSARAADAISRGVEAGSASFRSFFDRRSPGERQRANLVKTKKQRTALSRLSSPPDRMFKVLTTAQPPKPAGARPVEVAVSSPTVPPAALLGAPPVVDTPVAITESLPPPVGTPDVPVFPPVGTPDNPVLPPPVVSNPEPPIVTPVPEPGTWALMLLGFLGIGFAVRRKNPREGASLAAG